MFQELKTKQKPGIAVFSPHKLPSEHFVTLFCRLSTARVRLLEHAGPGQGVQGGDHSLERPQPLGAEGCYKQAAFRVGCDC